MFAVFVLERNHLRNARKSGQHALSVNVAQSAVNAVFPEQLVGYRVVLNAELLLIRCEFVNLFKCHVASSFIVWSDGRISSPNPLW